MKIAMFTDAYFPRVNGVGVSVKCFGQALAKRGNKVCVVCPAYDKQKEILTENTEVKGFSITRVPSVNAIFSKEDRYIRTKYFKFVAQEMDKFKPEVIHINSEFSLGLMGQRYAKKRNIATIFTTHTMWESYIKNYAPLLPACLAKKIGKEIICFYAKRAQVVISPTDRMFKLLQSYGINRPIEILPTGIDDSICKVEDKAFASFKEDIYKEFPVLKNKKILLYVGRVVKEKNLYMLFDVFSKVKEKFENTALFFIGGGPELDNLKAKAKKHKYASSICFAGYRDRDILSYFYHLADVFVFPSCTETQGLVTIEAMRAGLPVVAIGEMGTLDVMKGDKGGFMVQNDTEEFAARVIDLLSDETLRAQKSKEAREWGAKWSIDYLTPKLEDFYKKALKIKKENIK